MKQWKRFMNYVQMTIYDTLIRARPIILTITFDIVSVPLALGDFPSVHQMSFILSTSSTTTNYSKFI